MGVVEAAAASIIKSVVGAGVWVRETQLEIISFASQSAGRSVAIEQVLLRCG
jgi:hypothetical protein